MATRALPLPPSFLTPARSAGAPATLWRDAALMLLLAFATRCWWFGDPVVQVDEQFYLLVGDRMLHGAIPYVDIWDRKPVGLFLVYAATRLLGGEGILQYQLAATLCAATTAFLVTRIGRRIAGGAGARAAGAASLVWTIVFDGAGGQSPVFYNPLVAGAALLLVETVTGRDRTARGLAWRGAGVMALLGIAIQIKYTVLFEGMAMGLVLLWEARRRQLGERLVPLAAVWIAIALVPTGLAFAAYWVAGHGEAFLYANFASIGDKPQTPASTLAKRTLVAAGLALPLLAAAAMGLRARQRSAEAREARLVLALWALGALVGFFAIGTLYKHYFLPTVIPLAVLAAPAFDVRRRERWRPVVALAIGLLLAAGMSLQRAKLRGGERHADQIVAAIRPHLRDRLFVFDGEPILYYLTDAPLASAYAFPNHLNQRKEAPAIGTDQSDEVVRVMASRPSVVVVTDRPTGDRNPETWEIVRRALAQDYRQVAAIPLHHRTRLVYALDDA